MKIKLISIVAAVLLGLIAFGTTISGYLSTQQSYETYLEKARSNAEREIPYNAYQNYQKAFAISCEDEEIYQEFLEQSRQLGADYYNNAIRDYVVYFPESAKAYELLCGMYYDQASYKSVISTALEARDKGIATEKVRDWYIECSYMLKNIKSGFDEAQSFLGSYARVMIDGKYGYITETGKYLLAPYYEGATIMMGSNAAVNDGGEWQMINSLGYRVARTSKPVDSMSIMINGKISISVNGKYGYTDSSLQIPEELPYDYASTFKNGVAAVKKGDKWAIINAQEVPITDYIFEEILLDEFDSCINGGVIFVSKDGKYYMMDAEGNKISDQGFDDAYPFVGSQPAAVCINGKWGFADTTGNIVIEPQYEGAKSFNIDLGAVCIDGLWGYISKSGDIRVECQFEDCLPFSSAGIAAVKQDGFWNYVQLLGYDK